LCSLFVRISSQKTIQQRKETTMLIKTLLNKCYHIKGFVYKNAKLINDKTIKVEINARKNSKGQCSECNAKCPTYDHLKERIFLFISIWGYRVIFVYKPRRIQCKEHGIKVEYMPWANGKSSICEPLKLLLAHWAKQLSWKQVADEFKVSWIHVFEAVEYVVKYGLANRILDNVRAIGIDEIQYLKGHKYLTLVYQIDAGCRRLLYIGKDRTVKTLLRFFYRFGKERTQQIQVVCSDLWKPYLKVVKRKISNAALHILDRFHIKKYLNEALDLTRKKETAQMKKDGYEPILEKSRWAILKNKANRTKNQIAKVKELLKYNLKTMRCFLLIEAFDYIWTYKSRFYAQRSLKDWLNKAMRSKLPDLKKAAKRLRKHQDLLLNYFSAKERFSNGTVEGFNLKAKLTMRKAFGFRTFKTIEIALYHALGNLPEPKLCHNFY